MGNEPTKGGPKRDELPDDSMIFSSDAKKCNADDFTLMKLVGKGNFASVILRTNLFLGFPSEKERHRENICNEDPVKVQIEKNKSNGPYQN